MYIGQYKCLVLILTDTVKFYLHLYQPSIGVSLKTEIISILQRDLCSIYEDIGFGYILAQRSIQN